MILNFNMKMIDYSAAELNLIMLPIEILTQIMLYLSYKDLINMCNISQLTNAICQDSHLWANKAQLDFDISIQEFFNRYDVLSHPKQLYLQLSQRNIIISYLTEVFKLGMYTRGWKGSDDPYPIYWIKTQFDESVTSLSIVRIYKIYNDAPIVTRSFLQTLNLIDYRINSGFTPKNDKLIDKLNKISSGSHFILISSSDMLISSAVFYLKKLYNVIIPNFNLPNFDINQL